MSQMKQTFIENCWQGGPEGKDMIAVIAADSLRTRNTRDAGRSREPYSYI